MILTPLQKLTKNVGDLGKIIVVKCFEWLPKVQKIAQSGHTGHQRAQFKAVTVLTQSVGSIFNGVINIHRPSPQPTTCRSPLYSVFNT